MREAGRLIGPAQLAQAALLALPAPALSEAIEPPPAIVSIRLLNEEPGAHAVELRGLDGEVLKRLESEALSYAGWTELFAVFSLEATEQDLPPLLGDYAVRDERVRFSPRFDFAAGRTYVARWRPPSWVAGAETEMRFTTPAADLTPSTVVAAVYPSADLLPENVLRLYVQFSAPMSRDQARTHLRLVRADGSEIDGAFVAPERELWSPDTTRLTLFFDPGRIKRGVGPHIEVGAPLTAGESYRLVVDAAWRDARGAPLREGHAKEFRATPADRRQPDIDQWHLLPPDSPESSVELVFPEPLDRALLLRLLAVVDASGERLPGSVRVDDEETRWSFLPEAPWQAGFYRVRVDTALEDVAGNSLRRPFETEVDSEQGRGERGSVELPFKIPAR